MNGEFLNNVMKGNGEKRMRREEIATRKIWAQKDAPMLNICS